MRRVTETIARQWELLALVPSEPRSITTAELRERLAARGYDVDIRTIQRDLIALESKFMLMCRTEGRTNSWYWSRDQVPFQIPGMSSVTAITLLLVRDYLLPVLPSAVTRELEPYFSRASEHLAGTKFERWPSHVRILHRGPVLSSPQIDPAVRDVVYAALLEGQQFEAEYRSREASAYKTMTVSPLGLAVKDGVFYLVATLQRYEDVRQLALHRMRSARLLETKVKRPPRFSLSAYIEENSGFGYPVSPEPIDLVALFEPEAARHLFERKLAAEQQLELMNDGRVKLAARVANTEELRWWLLGFGALVEVVEPEELREEMKMTALAMADRYRGVRGSPRPARAVDRERVTPARRALRR